MYHHFSRRFPLMSHVHVVVAPYVLHPHLVHFPSSSDQVLPRQLYGRIVPLCDVLKKYTIPSWLFLLFFFCISAVFKMMIFPCDVNV